jgi:hypothetical protein
LTQCGRSPPCLSPAAYVHHAAPLSLSLAGSLGAAAKCSYHESADSVLHVTIAAERSLYLNACARRQVAVAIPVTAPVIVCMPSPPTAPRFGGCMHGTPHITSLRILAPPPYLPPVCNGEVYVSPVSRLFSPPPLSILPRWWVPWSCLAGWRRADCTGQSASITRSRPHPRDRQWKVVERVACLVAAARGLYSAVECHSCG